MFFILLGFIDNKDKQNLINELKNTALCSEKYYKIIDNFIKKAYNTLKSRKGSNDILIEYINRYINLKDEVKKSAFKKGNYTITQAARDLKIDRSQLNKYLNRNITPNQKNATYILNSLSIANYITCVEKEKYFETKFIEDNISRKKIASETVNYIFENITCDNESVKEICEKIL